MSNPQEFLRVGELLTNAGCMGVGELKPTEFRAMIQMFCGETGTFEFNRMECEEPNRIECRVLALCFAAAMAETGDL